MPRHSPRPSLVGQRFGRWIVIAAVPHTPRSPRRSVCRCDCGNEKIVNDSSLMRGLSRSCRCLSKELTAKRSSGPRLYRREQLNLAGQRFGLLVVIAVAPLGNRGHFRSTCRCDCGNEVVIRDAALRCGGSTSCGCRSTKLLIKRNRTHGRTGTAEHRVWMAIKNRCYRPRHNQFHNYGGRGIKMCPRWLNSFESFLEDMGARPSPKHSIERINNSGDYEPANCYWATWKQQSRNKRSNHWITFQGETLTLIEWAEKIGTSSSILSSRINTCKWPIERALTEPIGLNSKCRSVKPQS
jgi:hypothetical protein